MRSEFRILTVLIILQSLEGPDVNPFCTGSSEFRPFTRCWERDALDMNEPFCLVPICFRSDSKRYILEEVYDILIRTGEDDVLNRVWNHGQISVVSRKNKPSLQWLPGIAAWNNAVVSHAHFAMEFAFPVLSVSARAKDIFEELESENSAIMWIFNRVHDFSERVQRTPWTREFAPLLFDTLLKNVLKVIDGVNLSSISRAAGISADSSSLLCARTLLFQTPNQRIRWNTPIFLTRWMFSSKIARKVQHVVSKRSHRSTDEDLMLTRTRKACRVVLIRREARIYGKDPVPRRLLNSQHVAKLLQSLQISPGYAMCQVWFEGTSLNFQSQSVQNSQMIVAAHGAGLTNILFAKPCTILVEIFPFLLAGHRMYEGLANQLGLIYRRHEARSPMTGCMKRFSDKWSSRDLHARCAESVECSLCARKQDLVAVIDKLEIAIQGAVDAQKSCIARSV